ncbi:MAG: hypothetical protein DRG78_23500 [Epsilonproteobacteria bacterium]|nr:MAG: hypothetical protein DRG78_23500 [Campylobacterota bacterium]
MNNRLCNKCLVESCCSDRCEDFKIYIKSKTLLLNMIEKKELCDNLLKLKQCPLCKNNKDFSYSNVYNNNYKRHIAITCNYCGGIYHYNSFIRDNELKVESTDFFYKPTFKRMREIKINLKVIMKDLDNLRKECLDNGPYPEPLTPREEWKLMEQGATVGETLENDNIIRNE